MLQPLDFAADVFHRIGVFFFDRHFQQFRRIGQTAVQILNGFHNLGQLGAFTAKILCHFRIVPDGRVFQLAFDLYQAVTFVGVVKDTP